MVPAEYAILLIREGDPRARPALTHAAGNETCRQKISTTP